jgi:flagellar basal-body rod protein FlgF/flagellar basal-body rod protein FlgG
MPYGLYLSAAGADVQSRRIEILANNLANVDTTGFKRDLAVIQARPSEAIEQGEDEAGSGSINDISGGVFLQGTETDYGPGPLTKTDVDTHMAIEGEGFFVIGQGSEQLLTRAGDFSRDGTGQLVTQDGFPVLTEEGEPIILDSTLPFRVRNDGVIEQGGSQYIMGLVKPVSLGDLAKVGQTRFRPLADTVPIPPEQRRVRAGFLEASGVKPTMEMMELIEASRVFEANVRMIQSQDESLDALISRVLGAQ